VQQSSEFMAQRKLRRGWLVLGAMVALIGTLLDVTGARAQNLDEGKSATRLFADSCATCHRSPRGLAKGRGRPTLFAFLKEHYSTSSDTAGELASYLASLDTPQSSRSRTAAGKPVKRRPAHPPAPSTQSN
jgi:mono/diheme cytochrome c family protein